MCLKVEQKDQGKVIMNQKNNAVQLIDQRDPFLHKEHRGIQQVQCMKVEVLSNTTLIE